MSAFPCTGGSGCKKKIQLISKTHTPHHRRTVFSRCRDDTKEKIRDYIVKPADGVFCGCMWLVISWRTIELLELWDALGIPGEIPPHLLNLSRLSWEDSRLVADRMCRKFCGS